MTETQSNIDIDSLLPWSQARQVNTKSGPMLLRTAAPSDAFWQVWRQSKGELKSLGISCGKDQQGNWQVCHWQEVAEATGPIAAVPCPEGLSFYPYQLEAIQYALEHPHCLLALEMGLGKSVIAAGVINADPSIKSALIVCPATLRINLSREFDKWLTRPMAVEFIRSGSQPFPRTSIVIINYDLLPPFERDIRNRQWDLIVFDEIQMTRNRDAQRTHQVWGRKAIPAKPATPKRKAQPAKPPITTLQARRMVGLSGTPVVNRPVDLWTTLHGLRPDVFPNFFAFANRYCDAKRNHWGFDFSGACNLDELQLRMKKYLLFRRMKADVLPDLPGTIRQVIEIPANGSAGMLQDEVVAYDKAQTRKAELQAAVAAALKSADPEVYKRAVADLRDHNATCFADMSKRRHQTGLAKLPHVIDHVRTCLDSGGKLIVFGWHKDVISAVASEFPASVVLTGETGLTARQAAVDKFQNDNDCRLFVGNMQAAGVGITLTASSHVIFAESDWVPATIEQAISRASRIGQKNSVLAQFLVFEGSLDARMAKTVVSKQDVIDRTLDR